MNGLRGFLWTGVLFLSGIQGLSGIALGQFETRTSVPGAQGLETVAVGDFNGDGKLDLAAAASNLEIFLGNGDGTFQSPTNYLSGTGVLSVITADLNNDGKLDLVVTDLDGLYVLVGNGDGTFRTPVRYAVPCATPYRVLTGDFNGDKKLDLIVTYSSGLCRLVSVFLGNGDGTFQEPPLNTRTMYAGEIGIGDFNRDGKLDVVEVSNSGSPGQVLLGNGDGTFSPGPTFPADFLDSVAVADLRGSGILDLVVADGNGISVLLGNGDGTFQPQVGYAAPNALSAIVTDVNGDGIPDVVAAEFIFTPGACVLLGNGDGTFQPEVHYPSGSEIRSLAVGDVNGDGQPDLILPDYFRDVIVLSNTGVATFSPTTPLNYPFQLVGSTSGPQSVTLTNAGTNPLTISSMRTAAPFKQRNTCGESIAVGATCKIEVTFTPTASGSASGTVSISDSASSKPQVIELTGAGTFVALSPLALTFSDQKVGTKSKPQNITLTNQGSTALSITLVYLNGPDYHDFSESNNCPSSLSAGGNCTISVTFDPTKTGARRAAVYIEDSSGGSPQYVTLAGTGD